MYGDVVMGVQKRPGEDHEPFEVVIHALKHERYHADIEDTKLTVDDLKELVVRFKALIKERTGKEFPQDPWKQLWGATGAVFGSWMNDRAIVYRRKYNIPSEWGTAVNVQAMVYGNTGDKSGSGVAFTRDPATGEKVFYGEFLINAQGEDVVAGVRTPEPVAQLEEPDARRLRGTGEHPQDSGEALQGRAGFRVHDSGRQGLHAPDPQRQAHRPWPRCSSAMEMEKEKLIDWKTAIRRVPADQLDQVLAPIFDRAGSQGGQSASREVCPPVRALPPARCISTPSARSLPPQKAKRFCSSATKPRPKTCAA